MQLTFKPLQQPKSSSKDDVTDAWENFLSSLSDSTSSGAPVAPSDSFPDIFQLSSAPYVENLLGPTSSSSLAQAPNSQPSALTDLEHFLAEQEEEGSCPIHVDQRVLGDIYASVGPIFSLETLVVSTPPDVGDSKGAPREPKLMDTSTSSRTRSPDRRVPPSPPWIHPSLQRPTTSLSAPTLSREDDNSEEEESVGEPELSSNRDTSSEPASDESPAPWQTAPPTAGSRKRKHPPTKMTGPDSKRVRHVRATKTIAEEKMRRQPSLSPPPKLVLLRRSPSPPTPNSIEKAVRQKTRTPTPPKKPDPSERPGYPYWGAEHSANPPPLVSTPIERREFGLHILADPPNPGDRPPYPYVQLIRLAILGCPDEKLTIDDIYRQIMGRFEYFREKDGKCDKGWKNSVRHQMSLSAVFAKKERLLWEGGKGVWWTVNKDVEGGNKRERKRKKPNKVAAATKDPAPIPTASNPPAITTPSSSLPVHSRVTAQSIGRGPVSGVKKPSGKQPVPRPPYWQGQERGHHLIASTSQPSPRLPLSQAAPRAPPVLPQTTRRTDGTGQTTQHPLFPIAAPPAPSRSTIPFATTQAAEVSNSSTSDTISFQLRPSPSNVATSSSTTVSASSSSGPSIAFGTSNPFTNVDSSERTPFGGRKESSQVKGLIHTRWKSSGAFQFDATPRLRSSDEMDSEGEE